MNNDRVCLPRAAVAALVDQTKVKYGGYQYDDWHEVLCNYCGESLGEWIGGRINKQQPEIHAADCPVRIIQEILEKTDRE